MRCIRNTDPLRRVLQQKALLREGLTIRSEVRAAPTQRATLEPTRGLAASCHYSAAAAT